MRIDKLHAATILPAPFLQNGGEGIRLPAEISEGIKQYRVVTPWYAQWPLVRLVIFAAIPLWIIMLAIALSIAFGDVIADLCTTGRIPANLTWLCF